MLAAADRLVDAPWSGDTMDRFHDREVRVVRVIDGDTLEVLLPGRPRETFRVRLWGIDAPELARPDGSQAEAFSQTARDALIARVESSDVRLRLEPHRPRDGFDRILAHVLDSRGRSVNLALLRAGLARADDRWSHGRIEAYGAAASEARREQRGIWSDEERP